MLYKYQGQQVSYANGIRKWFPTKSLPAVITEEILVSLGVTTEEEAVQEPTQAEKDAQRKNELEDYLRQTDWYAIRKADTGEAIPEEIATKRQEAREEISKLRGDTANGEV